MATIAITAITVQSNFPRRDAESPDLPSSLLEPDFAILYLLFRTGIAAEACLLLSPLLLLRPEPAGEVF